MNQDSKQSSSAAAEPAAPMSPILVVPYMWIGDFVRCHTVVKVLRARFPQRPVDLLATSLCAPLTDYMPGVRKAVVWNLPRRRLALGEHWALAAKLRAEGYGTALIMPRTWKSALAPLLGGIPERVGFAGEVRFGLINDLRWGERKLPRMVDRCAMLALPAGAAQPAEWPLPELAVPAQEIKDWRGRLGLGETGPVVALAPGAVAPSRRWPVTSYAELARRLADGGVAVWVLGGPAEKAFAQEIAAAAPALVRDLTGTDLRNAILAFAAVDAAISNDSGLLHVAAAIGTPVIGIYGPYSPTRWAPLNPLAAAVEAAARLPCQPCEKAICRMGHHRCMRDISAEQVLDATWAALAAIRTKR